MCTSFSSTLKCWPLTCYLSIIKSPDNKANLFINILLSWSSFQICKRYWKSFGLPIYSLLFDARNSCLQALRQIRWLKERGRHSFQGMGHQTFQGARNVMVIVLFALQRAGDSILGVGTPWSLWWLSLQDRVCTWRKHFKNRSMQLITLYFPLANYLIWLEYNFESRNFMRLGITLEVYDTIHFGSKWNTSWYILCHMGNLIHLYNTSIKDQLHLSELVKLICIFTKQILNNIFSITLHDGYSFKFLE